MVWILFLIGFALLVYSPCLRGDWAGDDGAVLFRKPYIVNGDWKALLNPIKNNRGLVDLTYAINFRMAKWFKTDPRYVCHLTNNVLHGINAVFTFLLLGRIGLPFLPSLMGALAFIGYPLAVNAVANVAGRYQVLSHTFVLLGLLATLSHIPILMALPLVGLLMMGAMWSKSDALLGPALISAISLNPLYLLYYLLPLDMVLWNWKLWWYRLEQPKSTEATGLPSALPFKQFVPTFLWESIKRWPLWLLGLHHNISPSVKVASIRKGILAIGILLFGLGGFLILMPMVVKIAIIAMLLSPWSLYALMPLTDPILEHRAYGALLGVAILLAFISMYVPYWLVGIFLLYLCCKTAWRASAWDGGRVWLQALVDDPDTPKPSVLLNLSSYLLAIGMVNESEVACRRVLMNVPKSGHAFFNLAQIALRRGQRAEALRLCAQIRSDCPNWINGIALVQSLEDRINGQVVVG